MNVLDIISQQVESILKSTLLLGNDYVFESDTVLLGAFAELDSMAIVAILSSIEESFGIQIHNDEISADVFETFGSLVHFVNSKL